MGTRRLIPWGRGSNFSNQLLQPNELRDFYNNVTKLNRKLIDAKSKLKITIGCESGIFNEEVPKYMHRHYCGVIDGRVIIIMPNGDVLPCRRLPIIIGNIKKSTLFEIYYNSNMMWNMRNLNNAHIFCQNCSNFNNCYGGALCVNYCYSGRLQIPDIQCWRFYNKLLKPQQLKNLKLDNNKDLKTLLHTPKFNNLIVVKNRKV